MTYMDKARDVLRHGTATQKATTLRSLSIAEEVPSDLVALIEPLLEDNAVAQMYVPFRYGELRYIAAQTYAWVRLRQGHKVSIVVPKTILPVKGENLSKLYEELKIPFDTHDPIDWFVELRQRGVLKLIDAVFDERSFDLDE